MSFLRTLTIILMRLKGASPATAQMRSPPKRPTRPPSGSKPPAARPSGAKPPAVRPLGSKAPAGRPSVSKPPMDPPSGSKPPVSEPWAEKASAARSPNSNQPRDESAAIQILYQAAGASSVISWPGPNEGMAQAAWLMLEHPLRDYVKACIAERESIRPRARGQTREDWLKDATALAVDDHGVMIRAIKKRVKLRATEKATQVIEDETKALGPFRLIDKSGKTVRQVHVVVVRKDETTGKDQDRELFLRCKYTAGDSFLLIVNDPRLQIVDEPRESIAIFTIRQSGWKIRPGWKISSGGGGRRPPLPPVEEGNPPPATFTPVPTQ